MYFVGGFHSLVFFTLLCLFNHLFIFAGGGGVDGGDVVK